MGLSKEQVKEHIQSVEGRLKSDTEIKRHGYEFAKLCFQVKDFQSAIKYLDSYLTIEERNYRAQKWMGRLYEAVNDKVKAVLHYERSLELKKDQRDVVLKIAELYLSIDKPPVEALKKCRSDLERVSDGHPFIFSLTKKLQGIEGKPLPPLDRLMKQQLLVNSQNPDYWIEFVDQYIKSGKLEEASECCMILDQKSLFEDSYPWQKCSLHIAELYHQALCQVGNIDSRTLLDSYLVILKRSIMNFRLHLRQDFAGHNDSYEMCCLLVKFDHFLFKAYLLLRSSMSEVSKHLYPVAVKEMSGQLFLMAAQYLYFEGNIVKSSPMTRAENPLLNRIGDVCLLVSMRATPPDVNAFATSLKLEVEEWKTMACRRLSIAGWQLMTKSYFYGRTYLSDVVAEINSESDRFILIKSVFEKVSGQNVACANGFIHFDIQQSFLAADDSFMRVQSHLPAVQDLVLFDEAYVVGCKCDVDGLLWLLLMHDTMGQVAPVSKWLKVMFPEVMFCPSELSSASADSLSRCDLEAYLVAQFHELKRKLMMQSGGKDMVGFVMNMFPRYTLFGGGGQAMWKAITNYLISERRDRSQKRSIRDFLSSIRALTTRMLDMEQLVHLARHFKKEAERVDSSRTKPRAQFRTIVKTLLHLSSHYWSVVVGIIQDMFKSTTKRLPSNMDLKSVLAEAQFALGKEALYNSDTTLALEHFSRVNTPQAAWNQVQIYMLLADQDSEDLHTCLSHVQRALALVPVLQKSNPSDSVELEDKLLKKQEELQEELLEESPLDVCDGEESVPELHSTPTLSMKRKMFGIHLSYEEDEKEERIAALTEQVAIMQAEMKQMKSLLDGSHLQQHSVLDSSDAVLAGSDSSNNASTHAATFSPNSLSPGARIFAPTSTPGSVRLFPSTTTTPNLFSAATLNLFSAAATRSLFQPVTSNKPFFTPSATTSAPPNLLSSAGALNIPHTVTTNFAAIPSILPSSSTSMFPSASLGTNLFPLTTSRVPLSNLFPSSTSSSILSSSVNLPSTSSLFSLGTPNIFSPAGSSSMLPGINPGMFSFSAASTLVATTAAAFSATPTVVTTAFSAIPTLVTTTAAASFLSTGVAPAVVSKQFAFGITTSYPPPATSNVVPSGKPFSFMTGPPVSSAAGGTGSVSSPGMLASLLSAKSLPLSTAANAGMAATGLNSSMATIAPQFPITTSAGLLFSAGPGATASKGPQFPVTTSAGLLFSAGPGATANKGPQFPVTTSAGLLFSAGPGATANKVLFSAGPGATANKVLFSAGPGATANKAPQFPITTSTRLLFSAGPASKATIAPITTSAGLLFSGLGATASKSTIAPQITTSTGLLFSAGPASKVTIAPTTTSTGLLFSPRPVTASKGTIAPTTTSAGLTGLGTAASKAPTTTNTGLLFSATASNATIATSTGLLFSAGPWAKATIAPTTTGAGQLFSAGLGAKATITPTTTSTGLLFSAGPWAKATIAPTTTGAGQLFSAGLGAKATIAPTTTSAGQLFPAGPGAKATTSPQFSSPQFSPCFGGPATKATTTPLFPTTSARPFFPLLAEPWECTACCAVNTVAVVKCVACSMERDGPVLSDVKICSPLRKEGTEVGPTLEKSLPAEEDVIFLYEELPEPDLVAKAEKFMLPRSFYLYENKPPCPGCRGCDDHLGPPPEEKAPEPLSPATDPVPLTSATNSSQPIVSTTLQETTATKQTTSSGFSAAGMFSFSDIMSQSASTSHFSKGQGFSFHGAGAQLFTSKEDTGGDDNPEREADIDFKPIVTLPESFTAKSWDDDADELFVHRSKLFRFDSGSGQWKERGVGDIKILKHRKTGKVRVIMRRDQILKICCNHYITPDMKLLPGTNDRSWMWYTQCDYSDEKPREEKMAVRFKRTETAKKFKAVFDDCVREVDQSKPTDSEETSVSSFFSQQPVPGTWECDTCLVPNCAEKDTCIACKTPRARPEVSLGEGRLNVQKKILPVPIEEHPVQSSLQLQLPLVSSPDDRKSLQFPLNLSEPSSLVSAGESNQLSHSPTNQPTVSIATQAAIATKQTTSSGFSAAGMFSFSDIMSQSASTSHFSKSQGFSFHGAGAQLFSSKENTEGDDNPEREADIDFKPIVTLPESFTAKSWDDDADELFVHRSKLFRFDSGSGQWKERGVGDIKILKHMKTGKVRVIMRRDQILKICCNHYITPDMKLLPGTNDRSWMWYTQCDYSDEKPREEKMAVRFKHAETAKKFKEVFNNCVCQAKPGDSETSVSSSLFSPVPGTWECDTCLIQNSAAEETCIACTKQRCRPAASAALNEDFTCENEADEEVGIDHAPDWPIEGGVLEEDPHGHEDAPVDIGMPDKGAQEDLPVEGGEDPTGQEDAPVEGGEDPTGQEDVPVEGGEDPTGQEDALVEGGEDPTGQEDALVEGGEDPTGQEDAPVEGGEDPTGQEDVPVEGGEDPTGQEDVPVEGGEDATGQEDAPVEGGEDPTGQEDVPVEGGEDPTGHEDVPVEGGEDPTGQEDVPVEGGEDPTGQEDVPVEGGEDPTGHEDVPVEGGEDPTGQEDAPVERGEDPTGQEDAPVEGGEDPTGQEDVPVEGGEDPTGQEDVPVEGGEDPLVQEDALVEGGEDPTGQEDVRVEGGEDPLVQEDALVEGGEDPPGQEDPPVEGGEDPPGQEDLPVEGGEDPLVQEDALVEGGEDPPGQEDPPVEGGEDPPGQEDPPVEGGEDPPGQEDKGGEEVQSERSIPGTVFGDVPCKKGAVDASDEGGVPVEEGKQDVSGEEDVLSSVCVEDPPDVVDAYTHHEEDLQPVKDSLLHLPLVSSDNHHDHSLKFPLTARSEPIPSPYGLSSSPGEVDGDVKFLCEELPEPDLVAKAEKFMLPQSFYLYESKPPCPGCRGCDDHLGPPTQEKAPEPLSPATDPVPLTSATCTNSSQPTVSTTLQETTATKQTTSSGFSAAGMPSFSDIMSQSASTSHFSKNQPGFSFHGAGAQLFSSKEDTEGDDNPEREGDIDFKPIVTLPESFAAKSWDDDADELFVHRSKLFRFDSGSGQWKDRGLGDIKILKHRKTGKVRVIMRRDQILKICCNHYITPDMKLLPGPSEEKSWMWLTQCDYSDEKPRAEKMAVKFKNAGTANKFKKVFENCLAVEPIEPCGASDKKPVQPGT